MQTYDKTAISMALKLLKVCEQFLDEVYFVHKRPQLENFFQQLQQFHQNINFIMEVKSNGELQFLDTLMKQNNG